MHCISKSVQANAVYGYPHLQASLMRVFSLAGKKMREAALFSCVHLRIGVPTIWG